MKMGAEKSERAGLREIHLAIDDVDFDTIVESLRKVLTLPELPGFKGCDPCRSGLDRIILEDPAWRFVARQFGG